MHGRSLSARLVNLSGTRSRGWHDSSMTPSRSLALLATAAAALVLTACTAGVPYADLAGDPTEQDALPAGLPDHAYRDVDVDSSRYVGDDNGTQLWLVRGTERDSVCLLRITNIDADDCPEGTARR